MPFTDMRRGHTKFRHFQLIKQNIQTSLRVMFACRRLPEMSGVEARCICSDKTMKHQLNIKHHQYFTDGNLL